MTFDEYIEKQVEEAISRGAAMQQIEMLKLFTADEPYWTSRITSLQTEEASYKRWLTLLEETYTYGYNDGHHDALIDMKYMVDRYKSQH